MCTYVLSLSLFIYIYIWWKLEVPQRLTTIDSAPKRRIGKVGHCQLLRKTVQHQLCYPCNVTSNDEGSRQTSTNNRQESA